MLVAARRLIRWRATRTSWEGRRRTADSSVFGREGLSLSSASDPRSYFVREVNGMRARLERFGALVGGV